MSPCMYTYWKGCVYLRLLDCLGPPLRHMHINLPNACSRVQGWLLAIELCNKHLWEAEQAEASLTIEAADSACSDPSLILVCCAKGTANPRHPALLC